MSAARTAAVGLLVAAVAAGSAFAQGRSDSAPGQNKDKTKKEEPAARQPSRASASGIASPVTAAAETTVPAASANSVAYYGSWLDDASIIDQGDVWIGLATGYWRGSNNRQFDVPVASAAVGIHRRFQAGGSVSFYHFRDAEGLSESGLGNFSAYGKFQVLDPAREPGAVGVALTPLIEVTPGAAQRLGWALPVNVEVQQGNLRLYGSGGYFSRGSIFGTLGADVPVASRISLSANIGQSYARAGSRQTSFGIGALIGVGPTSGVYVGVGQTLMPEDQGPGGLSLAGGLSFLLPDPQVKPRQ